MMDPTESPQEEQGRGPRLDAHERNTEADEPDGLIQTFNSKTNDDDLDLLTSLQGNHEFLETLAGVAGNILEWYDFAVFGFFSDVIGEVFFPPQEGDWQTVESFCVFGGAFLMRPVGGAIMGYIGDVYGRKKALVISIFLMAFPTFIMGCLPSYEKAGVIAIVLLITTRLLQGLSVGGQLMSSLVFTLEGHDPAKWGLYGSFVMAAANFGTLLGNFVAYLIQSSLTDDQIRKWGWRIPFWSGIIVSLSGFYLRYASGSTDHSGMTPAPTRSSVDENSGNGQKPTTATESTEDEGEECEGFEDALPKPQISPFRLAFAKANRRSLAAAMLVPMIWSAGFYMSFVWMATYMKTLSNHPVPHSFGVNAFALLMSVCVLFPFAGILSDRVGRVRVMTGGGVGLAILGPIAIRVIDRGNTVSAFLSQFSLGVALSCWGAPMCAWLVESFEPQARLTSIALGYNLSHAIVGGTSPALATFLVDAVDVYAPGWILTGIALLSLFGLRFVAPPSSPANTTTANKKFVAIPTENSSSLEMVDQENVSETAQEDNFVVV